MCPCGKPLHYSDPKLQRRVEKLIESLGENIKVLSGGRAWMVSRHYIALHGIRAVELPYLAPGLGFEEVDAE